MICDAVVQLLDQISHVCDDFVLYLHPNAIDWSLHAGAIRYNVKSVKRNFFPVFPLVS